MPEDPSAGKTPWSRWVGLALSGIGVLASLIIVSREPNETGFILGFAAFLPVGTILVARRPRQPIGWLFLCGATLYLIGDVARIVSQSTVDERVETSLVHNLALWIYSWYFFPAVVMVVILTALLFPNGRLISARWRWVAGAALVGAGTATAVGMLTGYQCVEFDSSADQCLRLVEKQWGIEGWNGEESPLTALFILLPLSAVGAIVAVARRFVGSTGIERLQMKWFTFGSLLAVGVSLAAIVVSVLGVDVALFSILYGAGIAALPISVGMAITRHRLYEIDTLVRRTVTYGFVVGALGMLFVAGAVWLPQQLPVGNSAFAVAATTLAVAALFNPLRRRVKAAVDSRFNRLQYDPAQVADDLAAEVRNSVRTTEIESAWLAVTVNSLQPVCAAVWTKGQS